jgi:hypothetical protein
VEAAAAQVVVVLVVVVLAAGVLVVEVAPDQEAAVEVADVPMVADPKAAAVAEIRVAVDQEVAEVAVAEETGGNKSRRQNVFLTFESKSKTSELIARFFFALRDVHYLQI